MSELATIDLHDGRTLAYAESGPPDGVPLLHFHGIPSCRLEHRAYAGLPEQAGIRLICPDRPGIGASTRRRGRRVIDWASDVLELSAQLGLERFAVSGYSAGGPYALACASALPERLLGVGVMAGMAPMDVPGGYRDAATTDRTMLALARWARPAGSALWLAARRTARRDPRAFVAQIAKELDAQPDREALAGAVGEALPEVFLEAVRGGVRGIVDDYRALARGWGFRLEEIEVPIRWLHGGLDRTVPLRHGRWSADRVPGAELVVVEGDGHLVSGERVLALWSDLVSPSPVYTR